MEIKIEINKLRQRGLMIGTPTYGGMCGSPYFISMIDLTNKMLQMSLPMKTCIIENESLITRARNNIAHMFMNQTEFNRLLFIDADIKFTIDDVLSLLALSDQYPILCGSYPKKAINWDMVEKAVKMGVPAGELSKFCDNAVLNFVPTESGERVLDLTKPIEVLEAGTGFMMIRRDVFGLMEEAYPDLKYTPDYKLQNPGFDKTSDLGVYAFFDTRIHTDETSLEKKKNGVRRYLSEDYSFCELWRRIGGKIYVCPWINLIHHGTFQFRGNIQACMALRSKEMADSKAQSAKGNVAANG